MKLQKGKFLIKNIKDIGIDKRIIDLAYMGQFEYERNAIPISRMFVEYYKEIYYFYSTNIFNKNKDEMFIYANSKLINEKLNTDLNYIYNLASNNINQNYSLWEYINKIPEKCNYDFWWNIEGDYFIIFGKEKKS